MGRYAVQARIVLENVVSQEDIAIDSVLSPIISMVVAVLTVWILCEIPTGDPLNWQRIRKHPLLSSLAGYLLVVVDCDGIFLNSETFRWRT